MRLQRIARCCTAVAVLLAIGACASQPDVNALDPPGFISGLLHGFLIVFELIAGLFMDVRIYAFPNTGWWYDLGYFLGVGVWAGAFRAL